MLISIVTTSNQPIYEQIVNQIKQAIIGKELKEADMLPSIRTLAKDLQISVITTKRAYEELEKEKIIYSVPGKGFFVAKQNRNLLQEKQVRELEERFCQVVLEGKQLGMKLEEMKEMLCSIFEEEDSLWQP